MPQQILDIKNFYNTLFETLSKERDSNELQKLDPQFYSQMLEMVKSKEFQASSMEEADKKRAMIEAHNARRILKDIFDRRINKIVQLALYKSKAGMFLADTSALFSYEQKLLDNLSGNLQETREKHMTFLP